MVLNILAESEKFEMNPDNKTKYFKLRQYDAVLTWLFECSLKTAQREFEDNLK